MASIQIKPVVVRNEKFGLLIWSPKLDRYFLPDTNVIKDIRTVLKRKKGGGKDATLFKNIDSSLVDDLIKLGFNGQIREIDCSFEGKLSAPLDVYFDYTNKCNLRCSYCYNYFNDRNITMTEEKIANVLTQMSKNGVMRTHLAGGEPMINFNCIKTYFKTANEVGMNISVNSNGTFFHDKIISMIFDYGIITLTFSLDGYNAITNDKYRGHGSFEKTRLNAKMVAIEKKNRGAGPILQYKAVHMYDTPLEVYEGLIKIAIKDGMDRVQFHNPECSILHPRGYYGQKNIIDGYYERIIWIESLEKKYKSQIQIWKPWNPITGCANIGLPNYHGCIGAQELISINAEGDIGPCLMNKYNFGNLFSDWGGDFGNFWRGSKKLIEFQKNSDKVDSHCESCAFYSQCRGGRKTRVVVQNRAGDSSKKIMLDDIVGYDPYCARDYLAANPGLVISKKRTEYIRMNHHKEIFVAHSL